MKKGDLSKFVNDAVSREVFRANVAAAVITHPLAKVCGL
jgi:hypothetical protein